jgi:LEA14-like dessication related protein
MRVPTLLAAAALLAGGCAMLMKTVERPKVDVRDVALTSVSLRGIEGEVQLDISNPNAVGVPLSGIDWQLAVGGASAVSGHVDVSQTIPAHGVAPVTASLRIDAGQALAVASRVSAGARDYTLDARFHFSTSVGDLTVDVHHVGALSDGLALR